MEDSQLTTTMVMDADFFAPEHHHILQYLRLFVRSPAHYAAEHLPIIRRDIYADQNQVPSLLFSGHLAHAKGLYFLTALKNKFQTGRCDRKDRVVGNGYWHPQRTTPIYDPSHQFHLGYMTMLNFFESSDVTPVAPNRSRAPKPKPKSQWIMHEYTLPYSSHSTWAISYIHRTPSSTAAHDATATQVDAASSSATQVDADAASSSTANLGKRKAHHVEDPMLRSQRPRPSPAIPAPTDDHFSALPTLVHGALDLSSHQDGTLPWMS